MMDLLLFAREHNDGRKHIRELGDFVAHASERNRGLTTDATRDWSITAKFFMATITRNRDKPLDGRRLQSSARDYLRISVKRMDPVSLRQATGMRKVNAESEMQAIVGKMSQNDDGTWRLPSDINSQQLKLINHVISLLVVKPAFMENDITEEFISVLKSANIITKNEINAHRPKINAIVSLYMVASLHNCKIATPDGAIELCGGVSDGKISVYATAGGLNAEGPPIGLSFAIFESSVDPIVYCCDDLLSERWAFEIELGPNHKLERLC